MPQDSFENMFPRNCIHCILLPRIFGVLKVRFRGTTAEHKARMEILDNGQEDEIPGSVKIQAPYELKKWMSSMSTTSLNRKSFSVRPLKLPRLYNAGRNHHQNWYLYWPALHYSKNVWMTETSFIFYKIFLPQLKAFSFPLLYEDGSNPGKNVSCRRYISRWIRQNLSCS